jgi:hypothetical protein
MRLKLMRLKFCAAIFCATAIALAGISAATDASAQTQKKRTVSKKAAKKYGPVPVSMAPPRARITVTRRTFLDPGKEVIPGSRNEFTDYAFPPTYSPTAVIDNRGPHHRSPLPGPFDLPGRGNPYPWHYCVGC